ncbi:hypothetical protein SDC9_178001 [bioreactor metagenome]|uniref:Uncharacterized protein n=1 Tax=bioreactor metagenome TaxID=1076179 RepID=A0A645GW01_9ZZZZ
MFSEPGSQLAPQGAGKDCRGVHSMVMLHVELFFSADGGSKSHAGNRIGMVNMAAPDVRYTLVNARTCI